VGKSIQRFPSEIEVDDLLGYSLAQRFEELDFFSAPYSTFCNDFSAQIWIYLNKSTVFY
jgi:hypothetical protein